MPLVSPLMPVLYNFLGWGNKSSTSRGLRLNMHRDHSSGRHKRTVNAFFVKKKFATDVQKQSSPVQIFRLGSTTVLCLAPETIKNLNPHYHLSTLSSLPNTPDRSSLFTSKQNVFVFVFSFLIFASVFSFHILLGLSLWLKPSICNPCTFHPFAVILS